MSQPSERRIYTSPLRQQRAAETRQRVVIAGAELIRDLPIWNWRELTIRSVAKRAGLHERTVYRYFPNERELHDAVVAKLRGEAGVRAEGLELDDIADTARQIFEYASSFPLSPRVTRNPSAAAEIRVQREALTAAIAPATKGWTAAERAKAGAVFDVLWDMVSYERLVSEWELPPEDAISALTWAVEVLTDAVREGRRPTGGRPRGRRDRA